MLADGTRRDVRDVADSLAGQCHARVKGGRWGLAPRPDKGGMTPYFDGYASEYTVTRWSDEDAITDGRLRGSAR